MPHPARLDAPNTLYHVRVRGHERRVIFTDDTDREDFVACLAALAKAGASSAAWGGWAAVTALRRGREAS